MIDGGGQVTLSGMGRRPILYQDTCDKRQRFTTSHCDNQALPQLMVQHLTLTNGNANGKHSKRVGAARSSPHGRLKVINTSFQKKRCDRTGPDLGGGAVRALSQYNGRPVYVVDSTFRGGRCTTARG